MSVTMTKNEGVTILTMSSDPQSPWPPLCQILKNLCYSPVCCSVSQQLRTIQRPQMSILGTMQIMVGLLTIGLYIILSVIPFNARELLYYGSPFWLGALFIVFGITCILSERFSSPCLMIFNVIFSLAGVAFTITAIVLYSKYIILRSTYAILILLSLLQLCVVISSAVLGIKALRNTEKEPDKNS